MSATKTLLDVLRRHYIKPGGDWDGGLFVPECGLNGVGRQSRVDALYVGFTSTSGRLLVGHELKVSRADWRKELDTAGKADLWADNCHEWYIVAPGPEIVPVDELPHAWGLMWPGARGRMRVAKRATSYPDRVPSWDVTRSIMSRVDTLSRQANAEYRQATRQKAQEEVRELAQRNAEAQETQQLTTEQRGRLIALERLERDLGRPLASWYHGNGDELTPQVAAAALRLASATHALPLAHSRYEERALRQSAEGLLAGLDEFAAARGALTELLAAPRGEE